MAEIAELVGEDSIVKTETETILGTSLFSVGDLNKLASRQLGVLADGFEGAFMSQSSAWKSGRFKLALIFEEKTDIPQEQIQKPTQVSEAE